MNHSFPGVRRAAVGIALTHGPCYRNQGSNYEGPGMNHSFSGVRRAAAGIALTLLFCTEAGAQDVIKIGIPTGLSGANSVVAPSVVQSAELAVDEINAAGGILGKKVVLEVADDGSGAAGAQKAAELAHLPEEGECADLHADERRPQRHAANRDARQGALHLHLAL